MGLFANITAKIFGQAASAAAPSKSAPAAPTALGAAVAAAAQAAAAPASIPTAAAPPPPVVDVTAVLDGFASKNHEKLDWRRSIVDLMKLVVMESTLAERKQLAAELHYPGDTSDSAKMNVWLHKEVIKKLAANGGKVPAELLS